MSIHSYKDLTVWKKSIELVKEIYKITKKLPNEELYSLTSQMRRCAISIPSNIAEGQKRNGVNEYKRFLYIASASAAELDTQLTISKEIYPSIDTNEAQDLLLEIEKMLAGLINKLKPNN